MWRTRTVEKMLADDRLRSDPNWLPRLVHLAERDATAGGTKNLARRWANLSSALWLVWLATEVAGELAACLGAAQRAADAAVGVGRRRPTAPGLRVLPAALLPGLGDRGRCAAPEVLLLADLALRSDGERPGPPSPAAAPVEERFVLALVEVDDATADAHLGFLKEQGDAEALTRAVERLRPGSPGPARDPRTPLATRTPAASRSPHAGSCPDRSRTSTRRSTAETRL